MPPKKVENTVEKKVVKRVSKKSDKDPNEPKKNKSAYMFYCVEGRGEIKQENPDLDNKSVVIELGVRWTKIKESNPDKLKYYNDLLGKEISLEFELRRSQIGYLQAIYWYRINNGIDLDKKNIKDKYAEFIKQKTKI